MRGLFHRLHASKHRGNSPLCLPCPVCLLPATEALEGGVTVGAEEGTLLSYLLLQGCGSFRVRCKTSVFMSFYGRCSCSWEHCPDLGT